MQHVLFFAGYRLKVYALSGQRIVDCTSFEPTEEGLLDFSQYAKTHIRKPVRLLVDIIEEDFRLDIVPHVSGKDKQALHQRLLNKYFRNLEHRYISVQGRKDAGRKDDEVLIAGITNSDLLKPWLKILDQNTVALSGIYSLPLLAETILPDFCDNADKPVLLVSQQVPTSVRHSFYQQGRLKVSRLAQGLGDEKESTEKIALKELDKTLRYIENQRLIDKNNNLELHFLGTKESLHNVQQEAQQQQKVELLNGLKEHILPDSHDFADQYFIEKLAAQKWPKNHYGHDKNLRIYYHKLLAKLLTILSIIILISSALYTAYLFMQEKEEQMAIPMLKSQAQDYRQRYDERTGELSELGVEALDVQSSVQDLKRLQEIYQQQPQSFLNALSLASRNFPNISYHLIDWSVAPFPFEDAQSQEENTVAPFVVDIEARILNVADNPREALSQVNAFLKQLKNIQGFDQVSATKMPFDLSSNAPFAINSKSTGRKDTNDEVSFSFRIKGSLE